MKTTQVLLQQHAGWWFKKHWKYSKQRKLMDNGALKSLEERGIVVEKALDVVNDHKRFPRFQMPQQQLYEVPNAVEVIPHLAFTDSNVLVAGLDQAKVFTNSIEIRPESLNIVSSDSDFTRHDLVKRCIRSSLLFDAHQEKLPKRKNPLQPAWNFPRDYGLTDRRKNLLLCNRLVQLCSSLNPQLLAHRRSMYDAFFSLPVERDDEKVLLSLTADILITSGDEIEPPSSTLDVDEHRVDEDLPKIYPLLSTISLVQETTPVSKFVDVLPFAGDFAKQNVHTAIVHYNPTQTANIHDCDVTRDQFLSRSLMKAYTFALAEARRRYGNAKKLPQPVTVQCVQTDSKDFHFSVLQLNTVLDSSMTTERNFYWSLPVEKLYETCEYVAGKPVLKGYNANVFNTLLAFCRNN